MLSYVRRGAVALVACSALVVATACTKQAGPTDVSTTDSSAAPGTPAAGPDATLSVSPAADASGVSPGDPVRVEISNGALDSVTLMNAEGKPVAGQFDAGKKVWTNAEPLGYEKAYKLTVTGSGAGGNRVEQSQSFSTVKPKNFTLPYLRANEGTLLDKGTFGVGQPVVVKFDESIPDKAAAERTLSVTTVPAGIVGSWYWMSANEVHWRPKEYWPAGAKVTVTASVYGKNLGGGLYGQEDRTATFTIGRSKIAKADAKTHRMKIYVDGQQLMQIGGKDISGGIPISMGKGGTQRSPNGGIVDFTTNSGPHVMTVKYDHYRMTSASFGLSDPSAPNFYDDVIAKSIRITADGEFVHKRDWRMWEVGVENTSHGCINVGSPYIDWIYENMGAGDVVDVTGTNRTLDVRNGLGDWVLSWEAWQKGSAL